MDIKGKKFLVIGGAGFIGSYVVEELLKEDVARVVVYDNFCRGSHKNLELALKDERCRVFDVGGDILQTDILKNAMQEMDGVFHLAALWLLQCHEFPRSAFETNIRGTYNVLESCIDANVKRLIYSSSASVYGNAIEEPMTEDHPYNNWTFYGATKIAGEQMFKALHQRYGLQGSGLRYMNVYGPRQDYYGIYVSVIMKALDNIDKGKSPVIYGDGSQSYDFVDVRDVARANLFSMQSNIPFGFYNIGTGIKTSILDLVKLIMKIKKLDLDIQYHPMSINNFVTNRVGCPQKAYLDLGFKSRIGLEDGLRNLIDWYDKEIAS
jgi:UDP-glucose 4-epimerase